MKRSILLLTAVILITFLFPSGAYPLSVEARLYDSLFKGLADTAIFTVNITLLNKSGKTKSTCRDAPDSSLNWSCRLASGTPVLPGDRIQVVHGVLVTEHTVAEIDIKKANPGKDIIAGRITPRKGNASLTIIQDTLTLSGWFQIGLTLFSMPVDADGRFREKLPMGFERRDMVEVHYNEGIFNIYQLVTVPGLRIWKGSSNQYMVGRVGDSYDIDLMDSKGVLKSTAKAGLFNAEGSGIGPFAFTTRKGKPINVNWKDTLRLKGRWGFNAKVKPLQFTVDPFANLVHVTKTIPNRVVHVIITRYNTNGSYIDTLHYYNTTDAGGVIAIFTANLNFGDQVCVEIEDRKGNVVFSCKEAPFPIPL